MSSAGNPAPSPAPGTPPSSPRSSSSTSPCSRTSRPAPAAGTAYEVLRLRPLRPPLASTIRAEGMPPVRPLGPVGIPQAAAGARACSHHPDGHRGAAIMVVSPQSRDGAATHWVPRSRRSTDRWNPGPGSLNMGVLLRDAYDPLLDKSYQLTKLGPAIVDWLAWCELGGMRPRTLDQYERDLARGALMY